MPQRIYDASSDIRLQRGAGIITLGLGVALSGWYLSRITDAIRVDIHNFPAAFQSSPGLTIFFAMFKLCSYVLFGWLFAMMVYVPTRNLFFTRVISGRLVSLSSKLTERGKPLLSVQLERSQLLVPGAGGLEAAINDDALKGQELLFRVGAFRRVLSVDKLP